MTDRDTLLEQITGDVQALAEPRKHREPYWTWTTARHRKIKSWRTDQPSLLDQLRAQVPPGGPESDAGGAAGPGGMESTPPVVLDALDRLIATEAASADWVTRRLHRLGRPRHDLRDTVEDNLRLLVGEASALDEFDLKALAREIHRWHGWAATLTGWQTEPWRPHVTCPWCATLGSLRVNLLGKRATCLACAEVWEEADGSIGLLADYIRSADPGQMRTWDESCDHSWRLTTVGPDGIRGRCHACHAIDVRPDWPKGTPVWTELDEWVQGASA